MLCFKKLFKTKQGQQIGLQQAAPQYVSPAQVSVGSLKRLLNFCSFVQTATVLIVHKVVDFALCTLSGPSQQSSEAFLG